MKNYEQITQKYIKGGKEVVYWNPKTGTVKVVTLKNDEVVKEVIKKVDNQ